MKDVRHKHTIVKKHSFRSGTLRDADCVPHCRKFWSPVALRMSCSSSLVAAVAMLAAAMCRKPWLALNESLLMPPMGSMVLVRSIPPPWLHLPYCQQVVCHTARPSTASLSYCLHIKLCPSQRCWKYLADTLVFCIFFLSLCVIIVLVLFLLKYILNSHLKKNLLYQDFPILILNAVFCQSYR